MTGLRILGSPLNLRMRGAVAIGKKIDQACLP